MRRLNDIARSVLRLSADLKAGQTAYDKSCKGCHVATGTPPAAMAEVITDGKGKMRLVKTLAASSDDWLPGSEPWVFGGICG